jgi:DNA repair protein RecO (recombination protein O)
VSDAVAPPGAARLDAATLVLLGSLLAGDWPTAEASESQARHQANGVVAAYTQFHLERGLRSLPHLDRTPPADARGPVLDRTA